MNRTTILCRRFRYHQLTKFIIYLCEPERINRMAQKPVQRIFERDNIRISKQQLYSRQRTKQFDIGTPFCDIIQELLILRNSRFFAHSIYSLHNFPTSQFRRRHSY